MPAMMTTADKGEKPTTTKAKRSAPDWERIELDYRAGVKSLREIADGSGVSHVSISKKAKKLGWTRDLSKKIREKADELVNKAEVNSQVNRVSPVSERETIEANASAVAQVKIAHRRDIQRSRSIVMALLDEMECQSGAESAANLRLLGDYLASDAVDASEKLQDLYQRIISLPQRAKTMKDLGESLRVLVGLERQAFGMDDKDTAPADGLTTLLNGIAKQSNSAFMPITDDPELPPEPTGSSLAISRGDYDD